MENKSMASLALVLLLGIGLGYALAPRTSPMGMHRMQDGSIMTNGSMMSDMMGSMMSGLNGRTGDDFDRAFLAEMIVHHKGAVEMAKAALADAKHAEIKAMAQAIISAQTAEIAQMKDWQKSWYGQ